MLGQFFCRENNITVSEIGKIVGKTNHFQESTRKSLNCRLYGKNSTVTTWDEALSVETHCGVVNFGEIDTMAFLLSFENIIRRMTKKQNDERRMENYAVVYTLQLVIRLLFLFIISISSCSVRVELLTILQSKIFRKRKGRVIILFLFSSRCWYKNFSVAESSSLQRVRFLTGILCSRCFYWYATFCLKKFFLIFRLRFLSKLWRRSCLKVLNDILLTYLLLNWKCVNRNKAVRVVFCHHVRESFGHRMRDGLCLWAIELTRVVRKIPPSR